MLKYPHNEHSPQHPERAALSIQKQRDNLAQNPDKWGISTQYEDPVVLLKKWVDFQYGDHDFTLPGDQSVRLSEVLKSLAIPKNEEGDTLTADDIAEVSFSDKKLVGVEKDGDDWTITAKKAFDTEEELTLTLTNGDQVCVAVSDDNETTITSYITSVVTEKIVNGTWQSASEFQDGDSARITISYELTQGVITTEKPSITYQLPDGVTVNEAVSNGIIIVPGTGERQGTYTINKDGLVTLTFDKDEINKGNGFTGDIQFEATVHNTSGESTHSISFGGDSKSITVTKPEESKYDIHTQKTGTLNRKAKKINYKIVASTTKGTEGKVTITDMVDPSNTQNASIAYDQSSIKVVKIDAGGNSTDVSSDQYTLTFTGSETDSNFKIEDLPQLSAGECYEVTYTADADAATTGKYAKISNSASSQSGDNTSWSWCSNEIKSSVQKTGYYDAASDRIYWTITVNEDKSSDVSSWQINDTTPYTIAGDVTITNSSGNTVKTITNLNGSTNLNFKLGDYIGDSSDEARHDTYYIKYATKAPTGTAGESFTATNTVNVTDGGSNVGTSTGTVDGQYRDWDVAKNFESTEFTHLADG